jgi:hypothetical protein
MAKITYPPSQRSWYAAMSKVFAKDMRRKINRKVKEDNDLQPVDAVLPARILMSKVCEVVRIHEMGLVTAENAVRVIRDIVGQDGK